MNPTIKAAVLIAAGALLVLVGFFAGKQTQRFEITGKNQAFLLDRSTGRVWVLSAGGAWERFSEPPK